MFNIYYLNHFENTHSRKREKLTAEELAEEETSGRIKVFPNITLILYVP